jgi:protein SCO1/2
MNRLIPVLVLAVGVSAVVGCQGQSSQVAKEEAKLYDVTGTVTALDAGKKVVTIDHEDIPGLMKAMQMEFAVADPKVLDGLKPGDPVRGKLKADGGKYVMTSLEKR